MKETSTKRIKKGSTTNNPHGIDKNFIDDFLTFKSDWDCDLQKRGIDIEKLQEEDRLILRQEKKQIE